MKNENNNRVLVISYLTLFLVNSLVIFLANIFFPEQVVLGTAHISKFLAIVYSMAVLAFIDTYAIILVKNFEEKKGRVLTKKKWLAYLLVNFVGLWLIARLAELFGLGISSWWVVLMIAIALDIVQGISVIQIEKLKK